MFILNDLLWNKGVKGNGSNLRWWLCGPNVQELVDINVLVMVLMFAGRRFLYLML